MSGEETSGSVKIVNFNECIKSFDGSSDVSAWLKKIELVARIKNIKDVASLIPLYLEGPAFSVYDQMKESDQTDVDKIKSTLRNAFGLNKFAAYDAFRQRSWSPGETVDTFLSDLRRLAGLAGINSEELIRCAFVCGLPSDISSQLRASVRIEEAELPTTLEQARVLMDERVQGAFVSARIDAQAARGRHPVFRKSRCSHCGGDHLSHFCRRKQIVCWRCGLSGHFARNCSSEQPQSGNDRGNAPAPAAFPEA